MQMTKSCTAYLYTTTTNQVRRPFLAAKTIGQHVFCLLAERLTGCDSKQKIEIRVFCARHSVLSTSLLTAEEWSGVPNRICISDQYASV
jgi:hypothetical protein